MSLAGHPTTQPLKFEILSKLRCVSFLRLVTHIYNLYREKYKQRSIKKGYNFSLKIKQSYVLKVLHF